LACFALNDAASAAARRHPPAAWLAAAIAE
jgi:hypothetical protein